MELGLACLAVALKSAGPGLAPPFLLHAMPNVIISGRIKRHPHPDELHLHSRRPF